MRCFLLSFLSLFFRCSRFLSRLVKSDWNLITKDLFWSFAEIRLLASTHARITQQNVRPVVTLIRPSSCNSVLTPPHANITLFLLKFIGLMIGRLICKEISVSGCVRHDIKIINWRAWSPSVKKFDCSGHWGYVRNWEFKCLGYFISE